MRIMRLALAALLLASCAALPRTTYRIEWDGDAGALVMGTYALTQLSATPVSTMPVLGTLPISKTATATAAGPILAVGTLAANGRLSVRIYRDGELCGEGGTEFAATPVTVTCN